mmetsp:Transcript_22152/g.40280  ORF Transcript_22152/g.40280 Transcript_22152/m.40280 type:complete len:147 (-) Transcript_22152:36-476(-)
MASEFYRVTLEELIRHREARKKILVESGMTEAQAQKAVEERNKNVRRYLDDHYDQVKEVDRLAIVSEAKIMTYTGGFISVSVLATFMLLNRITKNKFARLSPAIRYPVRIGLLTVPALIYRGFAKRRALKLRTYLEEAYEDQVPLA